MKYPLELKRPCLQLALLAALLLPTLITGVRADTDGQMVQADEAETFPSWFPSFSWARIPLYQMFADGERLLTDREVSDIASTSDFICIEKNHGFKALGGAELGAQHEIARFKALKPGIKGLFYFNAAHAYPFVTQAQAFRIGHVSDKHKAFLLKDPKSDAIAKWGNAYYFDVLVPEFRTWWADTVGTCVRQSAADGLFVDQMHGFSWLRPKQRAEVARAQAEMMRMAKTAIGREKILLLNNAAHIPELFDIGDAFMFEHYNTDLLSKEAIVKDWEMLKKVSDANKIAVWRIGIEVVEREKEGGDKKHRLSNAEYEALSRQRLPFYLAAFLIGAQPYSYFQYGWGWSLHTGPLAAYPELKKGPGKPLGDYTRPDPAGWVFQREFEHASVWVDLEARQGRVDWKPAGIP